MSDFQLFFLVQGGFLPIGKTCIFALNQSLDHMRRQPIFPDSPLINPLHLES
jgi:hypothetical protein